MLLLFHCAWADYFQMTAALRYSAYCQLADTRRKSEVSARKESCKNMTAPYTLLNPCFLIWDVCQPGRAGWFSHHKVYILINEAILRLLSALQTVT